MKEVTETVSRVLEVPPEKVRILIHEMQENDFAVAGTTFGEMREGTPQNVLGK
jgi:4-oxalocrotonate tautomerase family enzyme